MIGVFGAAGFIGKNVVRHLRQEGHKVRAVSRTFDDTAFFTELGVECVTADMLVADQVDLAMKGLSDVIQLVSTVGPGHGNGRLIKDIETSLIPQVSFLELCQGNGIGRVVFASSGGTVYGRPVSLPISEAHQTKPINSYGMIKLATEQYLNLFSQNYSMTSVILRISNPFGPWQRFRNGQGLIANVLSHYVQGMPVPVYGDGKAERDYVYVDDVSAAFLAALKVPAAAGEVFNIGSGVSRSVMDVLTAMEDLLGKPISRSHIPARSTDVDRSMLDVTKAKKVLNWEPRVTFEEGLRNTLQFAGLL
jgi:UDP-glucose 4-epimerase